MLELGNGSLRLVIDPDRGASITALRAGRAGDEWLYHDPNRRSGFEPSHSAYDDVWSGGFEELFPNDAPGEFDGRLLADHGELWNGAFSVVESTPTTIVVRRECSSVPAEVEKRVSVSGESEFEIHYRLRNRGKERLWHLFKLHPAMRVEPGDRILLPGGEVTAVEPGFGRLRAPGALPWPVSVDHDGAPLDLGLVRPAEEQFREFVYVSQLPAGWCGLRRARTGEELIIEYPLAVFPHCWLFITYGGWRDYNTAVLEPCTNRPKDLTRARDARSCAVLEPGEERAFDIRVSVRSPRAD